jgi:hypothetical protein
MPRLDLDLILTNRRETIGFPTEKAFFPPVLSANFSLFLPLPPSMWQYTKKRALLNSKALNFLRKA